jgi:hypothetical protein
MTLRTERVYNAARKDENFVGNFKEWTGNEPPISWLSDEIEKVLFAAMYSGYLIGRYGKKWEEFV